MTLEQRTQTVASVPAKTVSAAPIPNAPRVAPIQHAKAAQPATQPHPPQRHELSKFAPTAPPEPTPLPIASVQPNPVPTQAVFEPQPRNELPAVPVVLPSVAPQQVAITTPAPTVAPSPVPTTAPTTAPSAKPIPTAAPTSKAATPAPPSATSAPTSAPVVAKATAAPSASPAAAVAQATAAPAPKAGVPSPSPTQGASQISSATGTAPSPGPKGQSSPGPKAGNSPVSKPGPERPISVRPTANPNAGASGGSNPASNLASDINSKLRGMLGNNKVNPTQGSYHPPIGLQGAMEPSPPPDVLAATKYIFEENGAGGDAMEKMWVTNVRHEGPLTVCEGWQIRYVRTTQNAPQVGTVAHPIAGGIQIGTAALPGGRGRALIVGLTSTTCSMRKLVPFAPSPTTSP